MEVGSQAYEQEGYELQGEGSMDRVEENETAVLFGRLGDELQMLVQRYNVPPMELEELFQVVQHMFELMDADQASLAQANREREEIESLWKDEKDKRKATQRLKLDLECRLEEEQLRMESDKVELEKNKALLQTRVKQLQEHNTCAQQDLQKLKDKISQNEQARKELLEQYKKQADMAKFMTLRRPKKGGSGTLKRRNLPIIPRTAPTGPGWGEDGRFTTSLSGTHITHAATKTEAFLGSAEVPEIVFSHDAKDEEEGRTARPLQRSVSPLPAPPRSLADELEKEEEKNSTGQHMNGFQNGNGTSKNGNRTATAAIAATRNGTQSHNLDESLESAGGASSEAEGEWFAEDDGFLEEMMGVDPLMRTEVEMLQKEKETWESDQNQLEKEKRRMREQKEAFERQNTQLQVELKQLQESHKDLQDRLVDVKKERDEILDNYLEQPFDEYCITRKELHQLLMKQQLTALELEKAKEEKLALQKELESRRSIFEKLRERWRKLFAKPLQSATQEMTEKISRGPALLPVVRDISSALKDGGFVIQKEWLMSCDSQMALGKLPHWMGQITLKGVETERIECSVVARIYQSPIRNLPQNCSPPQFRGLSPHQQLALRSSLQQLHAEVWVATIEASSARIEIIDVIARPPKVRQRFVIKPKTSHIVCMLSIPGRIEESNDFVDSALLSQETEWMDSSFASPSRCSSSYLGPRVSFKGRARPNSAPKDRLARDLMASTPNLSTLHCASDPGPFIKQPELLFSSYSPETRPKFRKSKSCQDGHLHDNTDSSSTSSLTTIDEAAGLDEDPISSSDPLQEQTGQKGPASAADGMTEGKMEGTRSSRRKGSGLGNTSSASVRCDDSNEDYVDISVVTSPGVSRDRVYTEPSPLTSTPTDKKQNLEAAASSDRRYTVNGRLSLVSKEEEEEGGPRFSIDEVDYDCTDGGDISVTGSSQDQSPVMWVVTEAKDLLFFPTTDPSHRPINHAKLAQRALCLEYVKGVGSQRPRVFIGHAKSTISVYHMDEFQTGVWDIENPEKITLPSANPNERHDIKCIAGVGDRIWVGAGPSVFFLNAEMPSIREGSVFLDNYRRRPEKLLPIDDVVVVSTKGSVFYVFDSRSAHVLQKFDVGHITRHLDLPLPLGLQPGSTRFISAPTDIKTMTTDGELLYLGTSNGKVVSVPISALKTSAAARQFVLSQSVSVDRETNSELEAAVKERETVRSPASPSGKKEKSRREKHSRSKDKDDRSTRKDRGAKEDKLLQEIREEEKHREEKLTKERREEEKALKEKKAMAESHCLQFSAVAVHSHMDERVRNLIFLRLPELSLSKLKQAAEMMQYHSLPNLTSPYGGRIPISPPILSFRSLMVSVGRGHVEYVEEKKGEESEDGGNTEIHRERHEAFQLLVWGHKNTT